MAQPAQFDTNVPVTMGALNVPAPRPVENDSTAELIGTLGNTALNVADTAQRATALGVANKQKAAVQGAVATYAAQIGQLQQAVAQGVMSSSAARTRVRALRNQVIANNPSALPQVDSATSAFLSDSGLGSDIVKGTDAEQQQAKTVSQMASEGWNITPNMSQDDQQNLIHAWQQQKIAQQQLQIIAQQIAVTRGKLGITSDQLGIQGKQQSLATGAITQQIDQLNLENKLHQTAANQAVFSGANAWTTNFASRMQSIVQTYNNSGKTPADQQQAIDQINLELAQITANASKAGIGGDQSVIDQAIAPMKALATATSGFISGKIQTQGLADATANAKNSAMLLAIHSADEKSRKILGIAIAAPGMSSSLLASLVDGAVLQMVGENSQEPGSSATGKPIGADTAVGRGDPNYGSVDAYLSGIKTTIAKSNLGTLDPNSQHMLDNNITNIASGLLQGNTKAKTPGDYNRIISFFADPAVNAYVVKHPGMGNLKGVQDMLAQEYSMNVMPVVMQEWKDSMVNHGPATWDNSITISTPYGPSTVKGYKQVSPSAIVHPEFTGAGIRFVPNATGDSQAQEKADSLNEKVAPIIGRLIRANATLGGTSNYRKVWNEDYAHWFDSPEESFKRGLDAPAANEPKVDNENSSTGKPSGSSIISMDKANEQVLNAIGGVESNHDNSAVSPKGAVSEYGIMPKTAQKVFGVDPEELKKDPDLAREISRQYLDKQLDRFGGNLKLALAAYNGGPTLVSSLLKTHHATTFDEIAQYLPQETRDYVPKVINGMSGS